MRVYDTACMRVCWRHQESEQEEANKEMMTLMCINCSSKVNVPAGTQRFACEVCLRTNVVDPGLNVSNFKLLTKKKLLWSSLSEEYCEPLVWGTLAD